MAANDGDEIVRMSVAQAAAETAPDLVASLPLAARTQLLNNTASLMLSIPPRFASYAKSIKDALSDTHCGSLCQL